MARVYSVLLFEGPVPVGLVQEDEVEPFVGVEMGAVPTGHTYVVRQLTSSCTPTSGARAILQLVGTGTFAIDLPFPASAGYVSWQGNLVLPAGKTWRLRAITAAQNVTVSGYDLVDD